jgi:hypothetical protein
VETQNSLNKPPQEEKEKEYEWEFVETEFEGGPLEDGFQKDLSSDYTMVLEKIKEECRLEKENYINGFWRQSEDDLYAAEVLQSNNCCAQAIFFISKPVKRH